MEVIFKLEDIKNAAKTFLAGTGSNKVIAFHGEMGAGKTTFIHALCEAMGVKGTISSPTFSIINQYTAAPGNTIYHMDLYRLRNENEAINAGVEDCLYSGDTCLVEWPEKAPGIFPDNTLHVTITMLDTNTRKLNVPNL
ncbi:tRNA (adenosine(37)-N6)-threonylcarbamoyltransferase complex ATPase subunit type 1 TsaE [Ferruginibacter sp. SUN106]|uniref:tRNA (adenosine(37)-N6)-threonylcarbamoyltransferase complex ATPase subunit type 1 TsaE n=1 Tax=Ferruginibacter sp. SUN106 TaxID=2978348 RepID=UPI003D36B177